LAEYTGNIHIHTIYSDGHQSIEEIASIAAHCGLDFIIISDHETLEGKRLEGYQSGVLVLTGMEINDYANHYLALDLEHIVANRTEDPQQVINEVNAAGGLGIIAHPIEKGSLLYENGLTFPWSDMNVGQFQGIEVWNFLSQWRDSVTGWLKGMWLLLNPVAGLPGPYPETMAWLDRLQQEGHQVMLYGGSDAHGTTVKVGLLRIVISPYDKCFKLINVHIIAANEFNGTAQNDMQSVLDALRRGRHWVACDYYRSSRGFSFNLRYKAQTWLSGDKALWQPGMYFTVLTPGQARVRLIKNGTIMEEGYGREHLFANVTPGVYRVEAALRRFLTYRPWIYSNSIWVERPKNSSGS
jgi:hypothetical protein